MEERIIIERGSLNRLGSYLKEYNPKKVGIVTDSNVGRLYLAGAVKALEENGFSVFTHVIEPGDLSKNIDNYNLILCELSKEGFTRKDILIALGGGVTGDLTGFVAGCFMRGIPYVQVPTTLLSMVDSSIGGKTGINLKTGKNLAGLFHFPLFTLMDPSVLKTLPENTYREGLSEVVKYGIIKEHEMLKLVKDYKEKEDEIIKRSASIKTLIVSRDAFEKDERMLLNFGHTVGHALEALSGYSISHGDSVALGMVIEAEGLYNLGLTDYNAGPLIRDTLRTLGFLLKTDTLDKKSLYKFIESDKKRAGDGITLIVPQSPGVCRLEKVTMDTVKKLLV